MENYKGVQFEIRQDTSAESSRGDDNLGTMICFHGRYDLGDEHDFSDVDEAKRFVEDEVKNIVMLPLYLYDHSGITMNTTGFSCPWDSAQVGYIYVDYDRIKEEYSVDVVSEKLINKVLDILRDEVKTYDMHLTDDIWGYIIDDTDSCWGFYGRDAAEEAAREQIDCGVAKC